MKALEEEEENRKEEEEDNEKKIVDQKEVNSMNSEVKNRKDDTNQKAQRQSNKIVFEETPGTLKPSGLCCEEINQWIDGINGVLELFGLKYIPITRRRHIKQYLEYILKFLFHLREEYQKEIEVILLKLEKEYPNFTQDLDSKVCLPLKFHKRIRKCFRTIKKLLIDYNPPLPDQNVIPVVTKRLLPMKHSLLLLETRLTIYLDEAISKTIMDEIEQDLKNMHVQKNISWQVRSIREPILSNFHTTV